METENINDKELNMMKKLASKVTDFVIKNEDKTFDVKVNYGVDESEIYKLRILKHSESKALERVSGKTKKDSSDLEIRKSIVSPKMTDMSYEDLPRAVTLKLEIAYMYINGLLDFL